MRPVSGGAAAAPAHTSASAAPGRSASPPHAAAPGSAALTVRGLRKTRRSRRQMMDGWTERGRGGITVKVGVIKFLFLSNKNWCLWFNS